MRSQSTSSFQTFRFRLMPSRAQAGALLRMAGIYRFTYNWALATRKQHYTDHGASLPYRNLSAMLTQLRHASGFEWLEVGDRTVQSEALRDLESAFSHFFARRGGFPKFKSRRNTLPTFRVPRRIRVVDGSIRCPKIGWIRMRQSRGIEGEPRQATFKRDAQGHWYVTIVCEIEMPNLPLPSPECGVGIDLGLESFVTTSGGMKVAPTRRYRNAQQRLAREQRRLARKKRGSNNRAKQRRRVAKVHATVRNQRQDFLHKLSTQIVRDHDLIAVEDLNVKGLARTKLAKSIYDAGWSEFVRQLEYKAAWNRKHFVKVHRFAPTSKACNACGVVRTESLPLSVRQWECDCGVVHDRDINAARNILSLGLMAVGQTVTACGASVSQPARDAVGVEAGITGVSERQNHIAPDGEIPVVPGEEGE